MAEQNTEVNTVSIPTTQSIYKGLEALSLNEGTTEATESQVESESSSEGQDSKATDEQPTEPSEDLKQGTEDADTEDTSSDKQESKPQDKEEAKEDEEKVSRIRARLRKKEEEIKSKETYFKQFETKAKQELEGLAKTNKEWGTWFESFQKNPIPFLEKQFPTLFQEWTNRYINGGPSAQELQRQSQFDIENRIAQEKQAYEQRLTQMQQEIKSQNIVEKLTSETATLTAKSEYQFANEFCQEQGTSLYEEVIDCLAQAYSEGQQITSKQALNMVVDYIRKQEDILNRRIAKKSSIKTDNVTKQQKPNSKTLKSNQTSSVPKSNNKKAIKAKDIYAGLAALEDNS